MRNMQLMQQSIKTISEKDSEFPALLREIPSPPKKLRVWGSIPKTEHYLSIVGTRRCTAHGEEITRSIIAGLVNHNFTIVSGLARGIDTAAHEAALQNKLPTIAVLGSGIAPAALYPKSNIRLAEKIAYSSGAVISEYDDDFMATLWSFPQRNRIVAGLSKATLVIEAPTKSGALVTARFALDQNRDVLAVPGSTYSQNSDGTNNLIKRGAALITSADDVLAAYAISSNTTTANILSVTEEEAHVLQQLTEPNDINTLIRNCKLPASQIQSTVSILELRGIIKKIGSQYIKK
jgi:DNA processing protein